MLSVWLCIVGAVAAASPLALSGPAFYEAIGGSAGAEAGWFILFHAPWCGHCKALQPEWAALAEGYTGRAHLAEVDVDADAQIAERHDVNGYPTLLDIRGGRFIAYTGGRTAAAMSAHLSRQWSAAEAASAQLLPGRPTALDALLRPMRFLAAEVGEVGDAARAAPIGALLAALGLFLLGAAAGAGIVSPPQSRGFVTVMCPQGAAKGEQLAIRLPATRRWLRWRGRGRTLLVAAPAAVERGGTFFVPLVDTAPVAGWAATGASAGATGSRGGNGDGSAASVKGKQA